MPPSQGISLAHNMRHSFTVVRALEQTGVTFHGATARYYGAVIVDSFQLPQVETGPQSPGTIPDVVHRELSLHPTKLTIPP